MKTFFPYFFPTKNYNFLFFFFFFSFLLLQEFKVLVVSMESATQATREFLGNQGHQEILVNEEIRDSQGFVMLPCVIRRTTSGNITAKDPTSDDLAVWEETAVDLNTKVFWGSDLLYHWWTGTCDRWHPPPPFFFLTKCVWRTAAQEAETTTLV